MNELGGSAFPSVATLAKNTGLSERTVQTHLQKLVAAKWLKSRERQKPDGSQDSRLYTATIPGGETAAGGGATAAPGVVQLTALGGATAAPESVSKASIEDVAETTSRRDLLFEAVCEVTEIDWRELTPSGRGPLTRAVKELKNVGATPDEVRHRAKNWAKRYPEINLTAMALAKHWADLNGGHSRRRQNAQIDPNVFYDPKGNIIDNPN